MSAAAEVLPNSGKLSSGDAVFLIHGTFSSQTKWIEPDRTMGSAISKLVPHINIMPFRWSGDNSHEARRKAGRDLADLINNIANEKPDATIHLVGHSHGGNVALHATSNLRSPERLGTITFLGTPFFEFKKRDTALFFTFYEALGSVLFWIPTLILFFVIVGGGMYVAERYNLTGLPNVFLSPTSGRFVSLEQAVVLFWIATVYAAIFLSMGTVKWVGATIGRLVSKQLLKAQTEVDGALQYPPPHKPVYLASVDGDEAGVWLGALDTASAVPFALWRLAAGLLVTFVITGIAIFLIADRLETYGFAALKLNAAFATAVKATALMVIAVLILPVLLVVVSVVLRGTGAGFGWEGLFGHASTAISPRRVPAWPLPSGSRHMVYVPTKHITGLRHCAFYEDKALVADWAGWLRSPVGSSTKDQQTLQKPGPRSISFTWVFFICLAGWFFARIALDFYQDQLSQAQLQDVGDAHGHPAITGNATLAPIFRERSIEIAPKRKYSGASGPQSTTELSCAVVGDITLSHSFASLELEAVRGTKVTSLFSRHARLGRVIHLAQLLPNGQYDKININIVNEHSTMVLQSAATLFLSCSPNPAENDKK